MSETSAQVYLGTLVLNTIGELYPHYLLRSISKMCSKRNKNFAQLGLLQEKICNQFLKSARFIVPGAKWSPSTKL